MEIYDEKEYQCMIIIIKMLYTYSGIKNILIESDQWTDDRIGERHRTYSIKIGIIIRLPMTRCIDGVRGEVFLCTQIF